MSDTAELRSALEGLAAKWRKYSRGDAAIEDCADELEVLLAAQPLDEVVLANRCMRHRHIKPMNAVCLDGAECPICAQHNPPEPLFPVDEGGSSTLTRLQAEVECNRHKPDWEPAKDTSLTCGDLRAILFALAAQPSRGVSGHSLGPQQSSANAPARLDEARWWYDYFFGKPQSGKLGIERLQEARERLDALAESQQPSTLVEKKAVQPAGERE